MKRALAPAACLAALASACGESTAATDSARDALPVAFGLPRVVASTAYLSRSIVVEAVYQATLLSGDAYTGRVVNTGTLSPAYGGFLYAPEPADRLVVVLPDGSQEFVVHEAQGNNAAPTAIEWLAAPHVLRYTHRLPDVAEAELDVRFDGQSFVSKVRGWTTMAGRRYEVDLVARGGTNVSRDFDGQEGGTGYDLKGKITADGLELDVDERHGFSMAAASSLRLLPSQRGFASRFAGTLNNVLRAGGVEYRFQDVRVQTDQSAKGGTGTFAVTGLSGTVLREGEPFGTCALEGGRAVVRAGSELIALDRAIE